MHNCGYKAHYYTGCRVKSFILFIVLFNLACAQEDSKSEFSLDNFSNSSSALESAPKELITPAPPVIAEIAMPLPVAPVIEVWPPRLRPLPTSMPSRPRLSGGGGSSKKIG